MPAALLQAALPPLTQPTIVAVAVVYFSLVAAISVWAARRTHTASDFFVAGQGIGLVALALASMSATVSGLPFIGGPGLGSPIGPGGGLVVLPVASMSATVSGFAFIGGPGLVYTIGLGAIFLVLPAAITNSMGAWVLAKRMRLLGEVRGLFTVPDAIGARYESRAAQGLSAVAILVAVIGYMATNILALGVVINAIFGTGIGWGIWIGMGITLAYSVSGGILAGIYNDVL